MYSTVYLPWQGKPYDLRDTALAQEPSNDFCTFNLRVDPSWRLVDYRGPNGTAAFKMVGLKQSNWSQVGVRLFGIGQVGFLMAGTPEIGSCGTTLISQLRVQMMPGSAGCTGFLTGEGGNDYSACLWQMCEAYCDTVAGPNTDPAYLLGVAKNGHRGYVYNGGNNLYQRMDNCRAVGMLVGTSQLYNGQQNGPSGGSGLFNTNFGTTACVLVHQPNGGMPYFAHGGRHELGGALLSHGNPTGWEPAQTAVALSDMVIDGFMPQAGCPGVYDPGAFISCRSDSNYSFNRLVMGGAPINQDALVLAHNGPKAGRVSFNDCVLTFDPGMARKLAGDWYVQWNGAGLG